MSQAKGFLAGCLTLLIILGALSFGTARAFTDPTSQGSQGDNGGTIQALLNEVRQLRLAIQRSNLNSYRAQVALERLRLQQQEVDRLNDKLGAAREQIAILQREKSNVSGEIQRLEGQLSQEADPSKRRELENQQQMTKLALARLPEMMSQARETESLLSGQLQMEQAKLNELNDRLDTFQKELENLANSQQNGNR